MAGLFLGGESLVEFGLEFGLVGGEDGCHTVTRLALEGFDFAFALDDEAHGHRLYASGREVGLQLAPQHGREGEADDAVEHAAGLLGVDEVEVDVAWLLDGVEDGGLRDFVEDDAPGVLDWQAEHLGQVPRDGFSFAVFIACEPDGVGLLGGCAQGADEFGLLGGYFVLGLEVLEIDAEVVFLQVADVSVTGQHFVVLAEEPLECLCLGGRLDDDEVFGRSLAGLRFLCFFLHIGCV